MARTVPVAEAFRVAAQKTIEATHKLLVETAKQKHAEIMNRDPRPASFTRYVDGREGAAEESVRAGGVIVYRYPRLEAVAQFAMEALFDLSPVLSGAYRTSHMLFLNASPVANLQDLRPGDEISIANPLPYARKIEVGAMTMRVPGSDLVYQQARRKVMSRWGNVAKVDFTYRAIIGGGQINQAAAASTGQPWWLGGAAARPATGATETRIAKAFGATAHNRANLRFPCLIIRER